MTAPNSSSVDPLDNATPHSSTVAAVPHARRRAHPAGASTTRVLQNHYPPKDTEHELQSGQSTPFVPSGLAVRAPIVIRPSGHPGFNAPKAATFFLGKDHERWRKYDRERFSGFEALPFLRPLAQIRPPSGQSSAVDVPESDSKANDAATTETQSRPKKVKHSTEEQSAKKEKKSGTKSHSTKSRTKEAPKPKPGPHGMLDLDEAARPHLRRLRSNLEEAAAAAAASTEATPVEEEGGEEVEVLEDAVGLQASLSDAALEGKGPLSAQYLRSLLPATPRSPLPRSASRGAPPLKLAKRQQPQKVEGTLYDKTGPYREGAVSDGLSVRLFSAIQEPHTSSFEDADLSNSEHPVTKPWGRHGSSSSYDDSDAADDAIYMSTARRRSNSSGMQRRPSPRSSFSESDPTFTTEPDSAVDDSNAVYLITTPDNRVSSAAKLRRWAMDTAGNFYAAMEIKSIEAKLRAADPSAGRVTRELAKELEETYLDDILDEVQKAQTLNPTRSRAVAKILKTEDDRYICLEEDYPEEAFFVIAGCEEAELNGVILNIFSQAIRTLARFHKSGWMHGDVKLENLMFDENGALVVIDYENANPYRGIPGGDGQVQLRMCL
ncbi:hypothetical protein NDA16_000736 [Ustilago loliicola]|nr:hypothetical protein NDA16_000736 [Ustilago loliicola]